MKLILTEKYSVASEFAGVLGAKSVVQGKCRWFESSGFVIVWAVGHLFRLMEPEEYDQKYSYWRLDDLPIIPASFDLKLTNSIQFRTIKNQIMRNDVSLIYLATDAGREGELIGRQILDKIKSNKPVKRIWLRGMTDTELLKAISEAKPLSEYDNIYKSAKARSESDWLLGINLTRAYSLSKIYGSGKPMHIGRCQTPILTLIYEREKEIDGFVPEQYWEVKGTFIQEDVTYNGLWFDKQSESSKIKSKLLAEEIIERIKNAKGSIAEISIERRKVNPPRLFNLTNLQRVMSKKYGLTAQQTLDIAQKLYEAKILSYPRTSSRSITSDMAKGLESLLNILSFGRFESIVRKILGKGSVMIPSSIVNDREASDHTAIMPIMNNSISNVYHMLGEYEKLLFEEVVLNLLSNFFPAYVYDSVRVLTKVNEECFITNGIRVVDKGWRQVYQEASNEVEDLIPTLEEGSEVALVNYELHEKTTKPPQNYSEADILSIMENPHFLISDKQLQNAIKGHGIGTEATRATIIETLLKRGYLRRVGKSIIATEQGKRLIESINIEPLKSVELTAIWEMMLEQIEAGKMDKMEFMSMVERFIADCIRVIREEA
ncbi:MAG: DNA topoisomerase III [Caulobacteraceae bacterium]